MIARFAAGAGFLLIAAHVWLMVESMQRARAEISEKEKLRRLATITLQQFSDPNALSEKEFWRSIGRADPMLDSWGHAYRLERHEEAGKPEFIWRSPGADGQLGSSDDLEMKVPFVEGHKPNLSIHEKDLGFPAMDAK